MDARVKPLVWEEPCERNNYCHIARTMLGDYYVHIDGGRHQAFLEAHVKPFEHLIGNVVGDIWAAKAAAQADYEARILAALEPAPDLAELVEAAKRVADQDAKPEHPGRYEKLRQTIDGLRAALAKIKEAQHG